MRNRVLNGNFYFPVDGHFVSQKQVRINEILTDYDSSLQLQWIPPDQRSERDLAFRVVCFPDGKPPYAVCFAEDADERLLAKVFEADQLNSPKKMSFFENYERAVELTRAKEAEEKRQQDHELAASVLRNNKSSYMIRNAVGELVDLERSGHRKSRATHIWR